MQDYIGFLLDLQFQWQVQIPCDSKQCKRNSQWWVHIWFQLFHPTEHAVQHFRPRQWQLTKWELCPDLLKVYWDFLLHYEWLVTMFSGWWFNACYAANPNGVYYTGCSYSGVRNGIEWIPWKFSAYSMSSIELKIQRMYWYSIQDTCFYSNLLLILVYLIIILYS